MSTSTLVSKFSDSADHTQNARPVMSVSESDDASTLHSRYKSTQALNLVVPDEQLVAGIVKDLEQTDLSNLQRQSFEAVKQAYQVIADIDQQLRRKVMALPSGPHESRDTEVHREANHSMTKYEYMLYTCGTALLGAQRILSEIRTGSPSPSAAEVQQKFGETIKSLKDGMKAIDNRSSVLSMKYTLVSRTMAQTVSSLESSKPDNVPPALTKGYYANCQLFDRLFESDEQSQFPRQDKALIDDLIGSMAWLTKNVNTPEVRSAVMTILSPISSGLMDNSEETFGNVIKDVMAHLTGWHMTIVDEDGPTKDDPDELVGPDPNNPSSSSKAPAKSKATPPGDKR